MQAIGAWGQEAFRGFLNHKGIVSKGMSFGERRADVSIPTEIGGHPDYDYLEDRPSEIVVGNITTLFVDLNQYTSRTLVMKDDPEELKEIVTTKKLLINSLVRFVQIGGGHVHSITGDGVMAFFGRKEDSSPLEGCKQALQTSLGILYYAKNQLNPLLEEGGRSTIRIRTGLDHSEVRWLSMGINGYSEVKAAGYGVDLAAKLLSPSRAWRSRVGQTLYEVVPEKLQEYIRPIDKAIDGDDESPVFRRQFKGEEVTYKKYMFEWERVIDDSGGDSDTAIALIDSVGNRTIDFPYVGTTRGLSVDDDDVTFG